MPPAASSVSTHESIRANLQRIEQRISDACARAGRRREEVLLIAVSKTFDAAAIDAAIACGVSDIGENRVQEYRDKAPQMRSTPRAHLIGHLQSNKAKDAVRLFDVVQTIDSADLATRLARHAAAAGKRVEVLVQVNVGEEPQKSGVPIGEALELARRVKAIEELDLRGFMTIPPVGSEEETREYFRSMRRLGDEAAVALAMERVELSMGMSEDFALAIEEGATMIRLGRAIFGSRESV